MGKPQFTTIVTPAGTAVFPNLNEPDRKFAKDGEPGRYTVNLRLDQADEGVADLIEQLDGLMQEATDACAKKNGEDREDWPTRHKPYRIVKDDDTNEPTGEIEIRFNCKEYFVNKDGDRVPLKPNLFNNDGTPCTAVIASGSRIQVSFQAAPFVAGVGFGVQKRFNAVRVIDLVSGGGGGHGFDFDTSQAEEESSAYVEDAGEL